MPTTTLDSMLMARRVRIGLLVVFTLAMSWERMYLLSAVGLGLIALTLWQMRRIREEIAVRAADAATADPHAGHEVIDDPGPSRGR